MMYGPLEIRVQKNKNIIKKLENNIPSHWCNFVNTILPIQNNNQHELKQKHNTKKKCRIQ